MGTFLFWLVIAIAAFKLFEGFINFLDWAYFREWRRRNGRQ